MQPGSFNGSKPKIKQRKKSVCDENRHGAVPELSFHKKQGKKREEALYKSKAAKFEDHNNLQSVLGRRGNNIRFHFARKGGENR